VATLCRTRINETRRTYRLSGSICGSAEMRRRPRFMMFSLLLRPKLRPDGEDGAGEACEVSSLVRPDEAFFVEVLGGNGDRKL